MLLPVEGLYSTKSLYCKEASADSKNAEVKVSVKNIKIGHQKVEEGDEHFLVGHG